MTQSDYRILELKLLEKLADKDWDGVCASEAAGQSSALGIANDLYTDLLVTLLEDGYLASSDAKIKSFMNDHSKTRSPSTRANLLSLISSSTVYLEMKPTYRGLRRIELLRDDLRRDRVLDKFGILLDGRYIISDLIDLLERTNGEPVAVLFADIDNFGKFNKDHGHQAGDSVLRRVFHVIKKAADGRGEVYRRGGEEVIVLLPHFNQEAALTMAEGIRTEVERTVVEHKDLVLQVTISIGVAASPPHAPDGPGLEVLADSALQNAKQAGRNRVAYV